MTAPRARVLAVDDDRDLLRLLSIRLRSAGFEVVTADSGEAALACMAVQVPDVVVTDKRMAGMDGLGLFDAIRRQHATLPVLVLTGSLDTKFDAIGRRMATAIGANAVAHTVHGAGHTVHLEAPDATARALDAWIDAISG